MRISIIRKLGKLEQSLSKLDFVVVAYLLSIETDFLIMRMKVTQEELVYIYTFDRTYELPCILAWGTVTKLEKLLSDLADDAQLNYAEKQFLLDLPNVADNRIQTNITILK